MPAVEHCNIVFCLLDSLSFEDFDSLDCAGDLPVLSELRKNSVAFTRCYTPSPQSSPARASLFTGLDPSVHGLWINGVALPDKETTFAMRLLSAGYETYLAGRCQLAGVSRWTTEQTRANEYTQMDWAHGPLHRSRQNAYLNWLKEHASEHYSTLFESQADPEITTLSLKQRDALKNLPYESSFNFWVGKCVTEWFKSTSPSKPFLAIAGFSVGDGLGTEPQSGGDGEGLCRKALMQADAAIGCIVEQLKASDHADDTVLIVASARGNCDVAGTANQMKERSIKVPLLISYPGCDQKTIHTPVSTIDIAPTVLKLANVAPGSRMQGSCLPGVADAAEPAASWTMTRLRAFATSGERNWQMAFCADNMKLVVKHGDVPNGQEKMSLYNLATDPQEQINLALDQAFTSELEDILDQMIDARCALEDRTEPRTADF